MILVGHVGRVAMDETIPRNAEWEVTFVVKPDYDELKYRVEAPTENAAIQFAKRHAMTSGHEPESILFGNVERIN